MDRVLEEKAVSNPSMICRERGRSTWMVAALLFVAASRESANAQTTERASVASDGGEGNGQSGFYDPAVSGDGRLVAFASFASDLVPADTNGSWDVFVHDRESGVTTLASVSSKGAEGNGDSGGIWGYTFNGVALSADGRWIAFVSAASNLVPGDTNGVMDLFVHDLQTGKTDRLSVSSTGAEADGDSFWPAISADGDRVAFYSDATNLVPGDTNAASDVFVHSRKTGQTTRLSLDSNGTQGNGVTWRPAISPDGRLVGFSSYATNLVPGDTNGRLDAFVHDVATGETTRVSVDAAGREGFGESDIGDLSADGRYVGFLSSSALLPEDTNGAWDDYVRDLSTGELIRVNVDSQGVQANDSCYGMSLSDDGRFIAFSGYASNLVPDDFNGTQDVFLHDRLTGETSIASLSSHGTHGDSESCYPELSADGRYVVFTSHSRNLVSGDANGSQDVFVHAPFVLQFNGVPAHPRHVSFTALQANDEQAGHLAIVLLSCTGTDGFALPNGSTLYLTFDACTSLGLELLPTFSAVIDDSGTASTPAFRFPSVPPGTTFDAAALVYDPASGEFGSVTAPLVITTQ